MLENDKNPKQCQQLKNLKRKLKPHKCQDLKNAKFSDIPKLTKMTNDQKTKTEQILGNCKISKSKQFSKPHKCQNLKNVKTQKSQNIQNLTHVNISRL